MSYLPAIESYANGMVDMELANHRQYRPEQFAKVTAEEIDQYRQRKIEEAKQLADDIANHSPKIVARINCGMLHPDNKFSRGLFTAVTGIVLPPQSGKTQEVIYAHPVWGKLVRELQESEQKARELREAELRAKQEAAKLAAIESSKSKWLNGEHIDGESLIDLARHIGIDVHPRTAGTILRRVSSISQSSCRISGGSVPDGVWQVVRAVTAVLTEPQPTAEEIETANMLFGKA